jgi:hypothetical protein
VRHDPAPETKTTTSSPSRTGPPPRADNPDEITIDDDAAVEDSRLDAPSGSAMVPRVLESIAPSTPQNPDEITLDDEIEAVEPPPPPPPPTRETRFLALDKCLPHRQFLEASLPPSPISELTYFVRPITIRSSISSRRTKSERVESGQGMQSYCATTPNG